jgi:hypothetical protein
MTFQNAYQTNISWHLLTDIMGIHSLVFKDINCYNPTWWFYSCIIVLYLLFPMMYRLMKQDVLTLLLLVLIISFLPIPFIDVIKFNIVAFALGMWMANSKIAPPQLCQMAHSYTLLAVYSRPKYQQLSIDDRLHSDGACSSILSFNQMAGCLNTDNGIFR